MNIFFSGLSVFSSKGKHLLLTLLSLEFMVSILFIIMYCNVMLMSGEFYMTMNILLPFGLCGGIFGLSILVFMIRTHGNDYFNPFALLQC